MLSVFHYLSLHKSGFYTSHGDYRPENMQDIETVKQTNFDGYQVVGLDLPNCDRFADCLLRLPMYYELRDEEVRQIIQSIHEFYKS